MIYFVDDDLSIQTRNIGGEKKQLSNNIIT